MTYLILFLAGSLVALNAYASRLVLGSRLSDRAGKGRQLALVWAFPLFGALLTIHVLREVSRAPAAGSGHAGANPDAVWYVPGPAPDAGCPPGGAGCE